MRRKSTAKECFELEKLCTVNAVFRVDVQGREYFERYVTADEGAALAPSPSVRVRPVKADQYVLL